jgi:hypothetical protein
MRTRLIAACLALLGLIAVSGCTASGVPNAANPGVNGSGHTNPEDPGAPNGGNK